jgi:hypothetical protein
MSCMGKLLCVKDCRFSKKAVILWCNSKTSAFAPVPSSFFIIPIKDRTDITHGLLSIRAIDDHTFSAQFFLQQAIRNELCAQKNGMYNAELLLISFII